MTTLKQGDLIKDKNGVAYKVMEVLGQIFFISFSDNFNACRFHQTEEQLKNDGYTWDTPAWEPELEKDYYYITTTGRSDRQAWKNDTIDNDRKNYLGIYQTKELAEAALLEIRRKLGK